MNIDEQDLFIELSEEGELEFVTFRIELLLYLIDKPRLLTMAVGLYTLLHMGYTFKKQRELAQRLGLGWNTYLEYRDELGNIGVIALTQEGRKQKIQFKKLTSVGPIKLPEKNQDTFLDKKKSEIRPVTKTDIATQQQLKIEAEIVERAKELVKKKEVKKKKEETRFANEDYELVLNAYRKYKGVGLQGPEIQRAKRAIKQMFLAQRSIKQIVDCMKFFHDNQSNEEMRWVQSWTVETVMKKMPEFVAGKLKARTMDDDYPDA